MRIAPLRKNGATLWRPEKGLCKSERNSEPWARAGPQSQKMRKMKKKKVNK